MAINIGPAWFNIPVKDIKRTRAFYKAVGFKENKGKASDDLVSFLVGANEMVVHFFDETVFAESSMGKAANTSKGSELMITLGVKTKQQINGIIKKVQRSGGKILMEPAEFSGGYYGAAFSDPDGHKWNLLLIE